MVSCVNIVLFALCFQFALSRDVYRAAIIDSSSRDINLNSYAALSLEAAKAGADILVLPEENLATKSQSCGLCVNNYDEIIKTVSNAARAAKIYVVTHVYENIKCQNGNDLFRSNLVFDRLGDIVSVYRKPVNNANCNATYSNTVEFSTDFGVKFGVLMEEDLIIQNVKNSDLRNYIVLGSWGHQNQFLSAPHFASSWAFVTKSNVISTTSVYGNTGKSMKAGNIIVNVLEKNGNGSPQIISSSATPFESSHITPLDLERSIQGYTENVCHDQFCCNFYIKTSGSNKDGSYGLIAFDGLLNIGRGHIVGAQTCAVVACAGMYKRTCLIQSENNSTNINFEKIIITGNFSENSVQFPTILTTEKTIINNLKFQQKDVLKETQVNIEINNSDNLLQFGIFGRNYENDFVENGRNLTSDISNFSDYISSENVQEFFDYIWIRLRVVILIVSIYVLEMM